MGKDSSHICPVCGKFMFPFFSSSDECPICGWMDDPVQEKLSERYVSQRSP